MKESENLFQFYFITVSSSLYFDFQLFFRLISFIFIHSYNFFILSLFHFRKIEINFNLQNGTKREGKFFVLQKIVFDSLQVFHFFVCSLIQYCRGLVFCCGLKFAVICCLFGNGNSRKFSKLCWYLNVYKKWKFITEIIQKCRTFSL